MVWILLLTFQEYPPYIFLQALLRKLWKIGKKRKGKRQNEENMNPISIIGWIALSVTIIYTCFGLPSQIHRNYEKKSTQGISLFMIIMLLFTFSSWIIYGFAKNPKDWYIITSNIPGAICISAILYQFWIYRKTSK